MSITIAASKGYLLKETIKLLNQIGVTFDEDLTQIRKLYTYDTTGEIKLLQIRPWDTPVYVQEGAADIGVVGNDVLLEKQENVVKLLDLKFGGCKLVLAGPDKLSVSDLPYDVTVASKYPNSAERYFKAKGIRAKILKLYGAIELAPLTGIADIICDLTATGATLKEHQLSIIDTVFESTAYLIANPVSMKKKYKEITKWVELLRPLIS